MTLTVFLLFLYMFCRVLSGTVEVPVPPVSNLISIVQLDCMAASPPGRSSVRKGRIWASRDAIKLCGWKCSTGCTSGVALRRSPGGEYIRDTLYAWVQVNEWMNTFFYSAWLNKWTPRQACVSDGIDVFGSHLWQRWKCIIAGRRKLRRALLSHKVQWNKNTADQRCPDDINAICVQHPVQECWDYSKLPIRGTLLGYYET